MPDITAGSSYTDTSGAHYTVNHSNLNSLVGSASINTGVINNAKLAAGAVTNAKIDTDAGIVLTKLENLDDGNIIVGNVSNKATEVTMSGDVKIINSGATTIQDDAVTTVKVLDLNITTGKLADKAVTLAKMEDGTQGDLPYYGASGAFLRLTAGNAGQILQAGGEDADPSGRDCPIDSSETVFTTGSGSTWTRPDGVTLVHVTVIGGGGGSTVKEGLGDGGDGGVGADFIDVSGETTVDITFGAGGTRGRGYGGATGWEAGGDGGSSSFGTFLVCSGGGGATNPSGNYDAGQVAGADGVPTTYSNTVHQPKPYQMIALNKIVGSGSENNAPTGYGAGGTAVYQDHWLTYGEAGNAGAVIIRIIG